MHSLSFQGVEAITESYISIIVFIGNKITLSNSCFSKTPRNARGDSHIFSLSFDTMMVMTSISYGAVMVMAMLEIPAIMPIRHYGMTGHTLYINNSISRLIITTAIKTVILSGWQSL